jgi:hypothetical protein
MAKKKSKKSNLVLLERLMADEEISPEELGELLLSASEDVYLDFKHGDVLNDKRKASATVRKYVSGFANSAGGILIIGVENKTWNVTGCRTPGGGDLKEWAARCLNPIAAYFSPSPRFQVVNHPDGDVLIISTSQVYNLVPCLESGEIVYYLRFHDETLKAPEYLISSLLLGKRQRPFLGITDFSLSSFNQQFSRQPPQGGERKISFSLNLRLENQSLLWADGARAGIIYLASERAESFSNHLLSYIEIHKFEEESPPHTWRVVHKQLLTKTGGLVPFQSRDFNMPVSLSLPVSIAESISWKAALYILSKDSLPVWHQVTFRFGSEFLTHMQDNKLLIPDGNLLEIKRLTGTGKRPIVGMPPLTNPK